MTRFLGWYLAAVLAAYSLSASWSLGLASDRIAAIERQEAQLSADLETARSSAHISYSSDTCRDYPHACATGDW
jgi:hypothetical protein